MYNENNKTALIRRDILKIGIGLGGAVMTGLSHSSSSFAQQHDHSKDIRFKFAHVSDTHISTMGENGAAMKADSIEIFEDVVNQLNETENLDFILFGGDSFDNSEKGDADLQEFLRIAGKLKAPYFIQFGNREASSMPKGDPLSKEQFVKRFQGHGFQGNTFWWSVSPLKDVTVLGLDTSIEGRNNGIISNEQQAWLKKEITANSDKFVIVLTHHLFLPTWQPKNIPKWETNYVIGNSNEIRPTGGFIGSYGVLTLENGKVIDRYNTGRSGRQVILIQDLHANYGVQKNIKEAETM